MTKEALDRLLEKFYEGQCSPEEKQVIDDLLDTYARAHKAQFQKGEEAVLLKELQRRIMEQTGLNAASEPKLVSDFEGFSSNTDEFGAKSARRKNSNILHFAAYAAAALVCIGLGLYYFWGRPAGSSSHPVARLIKSSFVSPGNTSASILLFDGKTVPLDSARASQIRQIKISEQGIFLVDKDGNQTQVDPTARPDVYNSLITQRGQQAPEMTLADGTKVWVNAASTLRFPLQFSGATREVELTGEAYFEVAHDASHPFIVHSGQAAIKVLGTHFNIMAYKDEAYTYATLLEGSIRITRGSENALLSPGQQGIIGSAGAIEVKKVDSEQAVAWLHGKLPMDNMDVHAFLREVSRWYDVDIRYLHPIAPQSFSGNLTRKVPLKNILSALDANGINAVLKDRTLMVSPK